MTRTRNQGSVNKMIYICNYCTYYVVFAAFLVAYSALRCPGCGCGGQGRVICVVCGLQWCPACIQTGLMSKRSSGYKCLQCVGTSKGTRVDRTEPTANIGPTYKHKYSLDIDSVSHTSLVIRRLRTETCDFLLFVCSGAWTIAMKV